ncbi:MAG: ATP-binding SpoIIE family protein phosphatase [Limnohabitans sp.]
MSENTASLNPVAEKLPSMRILVVDDDPVLRHILHSWLARSDYQCHIVDDMATAHQGLLDQQWDVVIADLNLGAPVGQGNGLDVIKRVNAMQANTACVLMTAYGEQHEFSSAVKMGIDRLLIKPLRRDEFLDMLSKLDQIRWTRHELAQARAALEAHHNFLMAWREREHRIAHVAQKYLLFSVPHEKWDRLSLFAAAQAQEGASGDLIDVCKHRHGIDLVMGDVMGKGLGAAIVSAGIKTSLAQVRQYGAEAAIEDLVDALRARIQPMLHEMESLLTLISARVDTHAGELCFVDFGAPYVLLQRASHGHVLFVHGDLLPLGVSEEHLHVTRLPLHPGDRLLFISDGILDGLGLSDVRQAYVHVAKHWADSASMAPQEFVQGLIHLEGQMQAHQDDKSCVWVQCDHQRPLTREIVHFDFQGSLDGLSLFRESLLLAMSAWMAPWGQSHEDWFSEFVLGATEVFTNIVKHGLTQAGVSSSILVDLVLDAHGAWLEFFYQGAPYVAPALRAVSVPDALSMSESGYGLFLIRQLFDRVDFFTEMTSSQAIVVYKNIQPQGD